MNKPNLSNLASIAEIGTAVVVIVSLVFIYQELGQNTLSTQDASYQQFLSNLTSLDLAEASDPELARISHDAELIPETLSEDEWIRFTRIAGARIAQMEYALLSRTNETMSELHWQAVEPHIQYLFCLPGYRKYLGDGMEQIYATAFLEYLKNDVYPLCN